ncbi:MAG: alpha/beta fold hydrolase [Verrucomicrobia bacterium]|nr:alpha/beta fold hydrolase [Verrucomicrobiota bacterium]
MPIVSSSYRAPWWLKNGHAQTVFPVVCRRVPEVRYVRRRLELADGDFLDVDGSHGFGNRAVLIAHGLEGSSDGSYVRGMVRAFNRRGWDALAMNFRGCSGEPNRLLRSYHSGATDDLLHVLRMTISQGYKSVGLIGFSLGGNMVLKLLGELEAQAPAELIGGVAISVPCDLKAACEAMARPINSIYMKRFLVSLREKVRSKQARFPVELKDDGYERLKTFRHFDDRYTAPIHGFCDAEDYWARCSANAFLTAIRRPTLLLNALDDPFLAPSCFPSSAASSHPTFHLETPQRGGHVGFVGNGLRADEYYSERRALEFLGAA